MRQVKIEYKAFECDNGQWVAGMILDDEEVKFFGNEGKPILFDTESEANQYLEDYN